MSAALDQLVAGDPEVQSIFDSGEMAHVCEALLTDPQAVAGGIRRYLMLPLRKVIDCLYGYRQPPAAMLESAVALLESAENVCSAMDLRSGLPPDCGRGQELSEALGARWTAFIAHGAAHRAYHDLPRERAQKRKAAKAPRPGAIASLAAAVRKAMAPCKAGGQTFKDFMQMWRQGHINGLTIVSNDHGDSYTVNDENGEMGSKPYTWGTLEKMYSKSY